MKTLLTLLICASLFCLGMVVLLGNQIASFIGDTGPLGVGFILVMGYGRLIFVGLLAAVGLWFLFGLHGAYQKLPSEHQAKVNTYAGRIGKILWRKFKERNPQHAADAEEVFRP